MSNPTSDRFQSQERKGFGRIPDKLFVSLCLLRPLSGKVFMILSIKANRFKEPVGLVPFKISTIANWLDTSRTSIRRALTELHREGLIEYQAGRVTVTHYNALWVGQDEPDVGHSEPLVGQDEPFGGSSRPTIQPQVKQSIEVVAPLKVVKDSIGRIGRTPKRSVVWSPEENKCKAIDEKWKIAFREHWIPLLGEDRYHEEVSKANAWLAAPDRADRRSSKSRLDRFLWNWMVNCL